MNTPKIMVMITANIHQVKARLSYYLAQVAAGEEVVICKHNRPVAELRPVRAARTEPRPFGLAAGTFEVPPSFFEPLPDEEIDVFYPVGQSGSSMRVAEGVEPYGGAVTDGPRKKKVPRS